MTSIETFAGRYEDGRIICEADAATIAASVHANGVALLSRVFDAGPLASLRQSVFEWSLSTDPQAESENSFHRIDHLPPKSKTPHIFHAYNLYLRDGAIDPWLDAMIRPFFTAMKGLQNALTENDADFAPDGNLYVSDWVTGWGMTGKGRLYRVAMDDGCENSGFW